jgi:hypothetical protein
LKNFSLKPGFLLYLDLKTAVERTLNRVDDLHLFFPLFVSTEIIPGSSPKLYLTLIMGRFYSKVKLAFREIKPANF